MKPQRPRRPNDDTFKDGQIAKAIYLRSMVGMKEILDMGELKFGNRNTNSYRYFKKIVMDAVYNSMSEVFSAMEREGVLEPCSCGATIRGGYKADCDLCNGCGHKNATEFNEWFLQEWPDQDDEEQEEPDEEE